jgi:hypothetical protein
MSPHRWLEHQAVSDKFLPHLSILVPQWGHIQPRNSICDPNIGWRRADIGVTQHGQCTARKLIPNRPLRSVLTTNTVMTATMTMAVKQSQVIPAMMKYTSLCFDCAL